MLFGAAQMPGSSPIRSSNAWTICFDFCFMKNLFLTPLLLCGFVMAADPAKQTVQEDDWWLPEWVHAKPDVIGFYGEPPRDAADQNLTLITLRWRDVNPADGMFDWSPLREELNKGPGVYLRLENSHVIHCPEWLQKKYPDLERQILQSEETLDNWDEKTGGTYYPLWHHGFTASFRTLLASLRDSGLTQHPNFRFWYIPGAWAWGEFDVAFVDEMKATGMKPKDFMDWWRGTLDAYVDTVGRGHAGKLMFTGQDNIPLCDDNLEWRRELGRQVQREAVLRGCGTRYGLLEKFDFLIGDMPEYGLPTQWIRDGRYQVADEDSPMIADATRWIAAENEEFGNSNIPWKNYFQLKMTALRTLQLRVGTVFMGAKVWNAAPELHHYMMKTLRRTPHDSPDAWCALREWQDVYQTWSRDQVKGPFLVRNLERWLMQREVSPEGITRAVEAARMPIKFNETAFEARRTRHAEGGDYLCFGVEDRFIHGGSQLVQVKVTYLDDFEGEWWIEYDAAEPSSTHQPSTHQRNQNDQKWKTVTFTLEDARFGNRQNDGLDFRIYNGGRHDLTVRFVRVIKLEKPM